MKSLKSSRGAFRMCILTIVSCGNPAGDSGDASTSSTQDPTESSASPGSESTEPESTQHSNSETPGSSADQTSVNSTDTASTTSATSSSSESTSNSTIDTSTKSTDSDSTSSCAEPLVLCGSACIDPLSDPMHCGAKSDCMGDNAGKSCIAPSTCQSGQCLERCAPGSENRLGCEEDPPPELIWQLVSGASGEAIWGSGPNDIYVSDVYSLVHFDGSEWVYQSLETSTKINAIWGSGPNDIWVTSLGNAVYHSKGDDVWERHIYDSGNTFKDIFGFNSVDIWAIFGGAPTRYLGEGLWSRPLETAHSPGFGSLWGSSPTNLYGVGFSSKQVQRSTGNGTWTTQTVDWELQDIWGSSATDIYAIGAETIIHTRDGQTWQEEVSPRSLEGYGEGHTSLWVLSDSAAYVGSSQGRLFRSGGDGRWFAQEVAGVDDRVRGIWGTGVDNLYVVTFAGTYQGTLPQPKPSAP